MIHNLLYGKNLRTYGPMLTIVGFSLVVSGVVFVSSKEESTQTVIPLDTTPITDMFKASSDDPAVQSATRNVNIAFNDSMKSAEQLGNVASQIIIDCVQSRGIQYTSLDPLTGLQLPLTLDRKVQGSTLGSTVLDHRNCEGIDSAIEIASMVLSLTGELPILGVSLNPTTAGRVPINKNQELAIAMEAHKNNISNFSETHRLWEDQKRANATSPTSPF